MQTNKLYWIEKLTSGKGEHILIPVNSYQSYQDYN